MDDNPDLTDTHKLEVKGNNMSSTLADRSGAGRVETHASAKNEDSRVAAVAKQDGFGGMVLQTKLFGDILSTVEYTANEKRDMINKYGFWGLIVFVWIPFMASGVLVGAMLGLLSRMKFMRVLWATFLGGAAASLTWAYTAEGIITVMHKYKLEAVIPIAIIAFVLMAVLHMRSTKNRRLAELFEDTLLDSFHDEVQDKYGQRQEQS
ncbi:MAG: small multi-drug export protein [Candidatus Thermoplasmatota archaeon]|nr:small multi-drug export protein [Candidatus Thermoplasmatota archaeon]